MAIRKWSFPHREITPSEEALYEQARQDWTKTLAKDCATDILKELHNFNSLNQHKVKAIGEYLNVNAELICREEGITYDIIK